MVGRRNLVDPTGLVHIHAEDGTEDDKFLVCEEDPDDFIAARGLTWVSKPATCLRCIGTKQ